MGEVTVAVVSIASTSRRRFFWAAWWTGPPTRDPFRRPDASNGGAVSPEAALRDAQKIAGRTLVVIEARWANAWTRVVRELPPWTSRSDGTGPRKVVAAEPLSIWTILGLPSHASAAEIKRAYHQRALEVHPDLGGDAARFRVLKDAYERATHRARKKAAHFHNARPKGR